MLGLTLKVTEEPENERWRGAKEIMRSFMKEAQLKIDFKCWRGWRGDKSWGRKRGREGELSKA